MSGGGGVKMLRWSWQCKRWDGALLCAGRVGGGEGEGEASHLTDLRLAAAARGHLSFKPPPPSLSFFPPLLTFSTAAVFSLRSSSSSAQTGNKRRSWWQTEE